MVGKGTYRLFVDDPQAGSVAFIGTIKEEGRTPDEPVAGVIALRLKLENRQISEVETFVVRNPQTAERLEKIGKPNHLFTEAVPDAQRMSRADLIKTANMYFSGMQQNDGKGVYPFSDDCNRIENGMLTTNAPLKEGQTRPDPATASNYSSAWGCKEHFNRAYCTSSHEFATGVTSPSIPNAAWYSALHSSITRREKHGISRHPAAAPSLPAPLSRGPGK
jgi:hypothetical protein